MPNEATLCPMYSLTDWQVTDMATDSYVVIRVVPESPIDGATFSTYLNDLTLQAFDAYTDLPISEEAFASPLTVFGWPPGSNGYLSVASVSTVGNTAYDKNAKNFGKTLKFASTEGISVGAYVFSLNQAIFAFSDLTVTEVAADSVTLSAPLSSYVPAGTVVTFVGQPAAAGGGAVTTGAGFSFDLTTNAPATSPKNVLHFADTAGVMVGMAASGASVPNNTIVTAVTATTVTVSNDAPGAAGTVTFTLKPPFVEVTATPKSGTPQNKPTTLTFNSGDTRGIPVGAVLTPVQGLIKPGTTVTAATATTLTLSTALQKALPQNQTITFNFTLSLNIAQHSETIPITGWTFFGQQNIVIPAAAATAILELTPAALPDYLDIKIQATRGAETVPVTTTYFNVKVTADALPSPDLFQQIPASATSLYLELPPPPGANTIDLTIPGDGSAPPLDQLYPAMQAALKNDPIIDTGGHQVTTTELISSTAWCRRVAYDIVWSSQNDLPPLPDALESLYTNPPNPGGGGGNNGAVSGTNNLEQDRQKFEGALNSFYSTRNATAERLTKFVAAASAAAACEQLSATASAALLQFPVDPAVPFVAAVDSEILLQGVNGASGLNFAVPAAYFYALGATLDKTTTAVQRFQLATGDAIERLLQQFATAIDQRVITASEKFADTTLGTDKYTPFQAARRLVALGVPTACTTPAISVSAASPLTPLVTAWLGADDPAGAQGTPTSYPSDDFSIWSQQLATTQANGYLNLDLDALTQGYTISPFTLSPIAGGGSTLTFGTGTGIGPGMPVSGTGIQPGTTVTKVEIDTAATPPSTTVTLSQPATGPITAATVLTFNAAAPVTEATTADCQTGSAVMTFGATTGIRAGMTALATGIAAGTTVQAVTNTTVTLSAVVSADVPAGTQVTFAGGATTLADQIAAWLPSTSQSAAAPTVETLKQVTTTQWTNFFTASPQWLPPFTRPVLPGASAAGTTVQPGYLATRIRAFVRAVQQFFTVSTATATSAALPPANAPATFDLPVYDPISMAVNDLGLHFGDPLTGKDLAGEAHNIFPGDPAAQAWLVEALTTINELWQVAAAAPNPPATGTPPYPVSFQFSVAEALYARGFRGAADITALTEADFGQALIGTVAYDCSAALWTKAQVLAPATVTSDSPGDGFAPINPDGNLVDCVPPPCLSPTGPIAYLQEMLTLSAQSTCEAVTAPSITLVTTDADSSDVLHFADGTAGVSVGMTAVADPIPAGTTVIAVDDTSVTVNQPVQVGIGIYVEFSAPTLGAILSQRRGPVGDLAASCANLETPLPLIDLVNECLEYLGSAATPTAGTVYDTANPAPAGDDVDDVDDECHHAARVLATRPEHSTPGVPNADTPLPAAYTTLKTDFSSCLLPYPQPLDVSRTYLRAMGSSRFEEMRTFRHCITEFVLDPTAEPTGFGSWLWRYPVRIDTAREYLGITPEEYTTLFGGADVPPCAPADSAPAPAQPAPAEPAAPGTPADAAEATHATAQPEPASPERLQTTAGPMTVTLPEFLADNCLSYCEFYELWQSGYVPFSNGAANGTTNNADEKTGGAAFPECEPCCPEQVWVQFAGGPTQDIAQVQVFIRLWRKLRDHCRGGYTFAQLRDICDVLQMWASGAPNPDFIRQLAAFAMLRNEFGLNLTDPTAPDTAGTVDAERTHLLSLWVGPAATHWPWALRQLIARVEQHAQRRHGRNRRSAEFVKLLIDNLDPLSRLAGFDPDSATDSWRALPTHTLRFAEVLAKIYASDFSVGELMYLFTAGPHLDGDDPFAQQPDNEALDLPFGLPDDDREHALWRLRRELLDIQAEDIDDDIDSDEECWPWRRIETALQGEFGFAPGDVTALAQHFFPHVMARHGAAAPPSPWFTSALADADTSALMWNDPADGPLRYDQAAEQLSATLPLTDHAVLTKLTRVRALNAAEQRAVQDLYFQPRALLAQFALLFADFAAAQRTMIEEPDEACRFAYFRRQVRRTHRRYHAIARHLEHHVAAVTGHDAHDDGAAALLLRTLAADENIATSSWEDDSGAPPDLTWTQPSGSALAALLGLAGTGLAVQYRRDGGTTVWRDISDGLSGFGHERNRHNTPVPTVLPALDATLTPQQLHYASVHNGMLMNDATDTFLGGAQGFTATWSGTMLIDREGTYEFWGGAPTPGEERPDMEPCECHQWRVVIRRGQRTWVILSHHWDGEEERPAASLPLKRGAYAVTAEFVQPTPHFDDDDDVHPQHTGFQVKYCGPDTDDVRSEIPHWALFSGHKDHTLTEGLPLEGTGPAAANYLKGLYRSSLRDIRRTYQRAFKALLLCRRLGLSAQRQPHGTSELGYLLGQAPHFAGSGYYRSGGGFNHHLADLDLDFLPLNDNYRPPTAAADARTAPSPQRISAMFDWWERLFDYGIARAEVRGRGHTLWHLFDEAHDVAHDKKPVDPGYLLRYMAADARHWSLDLHYFHGQGAAVYAVTSDDLSDERWTLRTWHADRWLRALQDRFAVLDIETARPDLWAADDPAAALPGETQSGNVNLVGVVTDSYLDNGHPRRYDDLRAINDGLRERGRAALIAYLCNGNRVALRSGQFATAPTDLSDLLLLDVRAGLHEKASRIEEAITAVQTFIRRSRLGLEPDWQVTREFARLWESRFDTFQQWQRARARELYRENWIEWEELGQARRIEAFRFLESQLPTSTLTLAAPGGLDWWPDDNTDLQDAPQLLQRRVPSQLQALTAEREGLTTIGRPEYTDEPTWLAALPSAGGTTTRVTPGGNGSGHVGRGGGTPPTTTPPPTTPPPATPPATPGTDARIEDYEAPPAPTQPATPADPVPNSAPAQPLPLWIESAMKLGTRFLRVAAAGVPQAALQFVPHDERPSGACCRECGQVHPAGVDEYYFWLINTQVYTEDLDTSDTGDATFTGSYQFGFQDSYYDHVQQQSTEWDDENQVPPLLAKWQPTAATRLAWCRVHNGQFGQPRRSAGYVLLNQEPDLTLLGRAGDSLHFAVTGAAPLPPGYGANANGSTDVDDSAPGFRYDLPTDDAVALPLALKPPAPTPPPPATSYPGGLLSYPFFAYHEPGTRLFPATWFATAMAVAGALRTHCGYELALRWYRRAFDPMGQDCAWTHCTSDAVATPPAAASTTTDALPQDEIAARAYKIWQEHGAQPGEADEDWQEAQDELTHPPTPAPADTATTANGQHPARQGGCCDATQVTVQGARNRAVTMNYCRTLIEWGDALMRRGHSPEAFTQARVLYDAADRITGPRPRTILLPEPATTAPVSAFVPAYAPLNPQLLDLYDLIGDRTALIHRSLDSQRMRNGHPRRDMPYFGNGPGADRDWAVAGPCGCGDDLCGRPSPYRFTAQIQKAIELAGRVRELGAVLLSAYEKGDSEYLASIRAEQEREMAALGIAIRQDQWRDADWQVQALQQTKDLNQANLLYYFNLYQGGLINNELLDLSLTTNALQTRTGANVTEVEGEVMSLIPDFFVGAMSTFTQVPIGTKLGGLFHAIADVMRTVADIQSTTAAMDATQAVWQRRAVEWLHQVQTLPIEIEQIELQILGTHRRRDQALAELNNQQRQVEHATEVLEFLRDKFTATELFLYLQKETAALHYRMYELAGRAVREAERSFNFELGHTHRRFMPEETWDSLHAGLMAGERLEAAVQHMHKTYLDENRRELELTKHISLRLDLPAAYLRLRTTGHCEISIPEWMFDLDYPGHYMRRIKNISLTLPCVTGPYTGVHCRLTLLSSTTRTSSEVRPPTWHCCCDSARHSDYEPCADDPRIARDYAARESIATSSGQNDSGLFELSFRDERYLPFEYLGAVSRWRIELPPENNYFDLNTVTDVVLNLNYTAREGGPALREAAREDARGRLPGNATRLFDVRRDFPDVWPSLRAPHHHDLTHHRGGRRRLRLGFTPTMFGYIPGQRVHTIGRLLLMFSAPNAQPGRHHLIRFWPDDPNCCEVAEFQCIASDAWPGYFCGTIHLDEQPLGPLHEDRPAVCEFEFPDDTGEICNAFVVAHYNAQRWPQCGPPPPDHCPDNTHHLPLTNGTASSHGDRPAATTQG
jgi:hypothetical protein